MGPDEDDDGKGGYEIEQPAPDVVPQPGHAEPDDDIPDEVEQPPQPAPEPAVDPDVPPSTVGALR